MFIKMNPHKLIKEYYDLNKELILLSKDKIFPQDMIERKTQLEQLIHNIQWKSQIQCWNPTFTPENSKWIDEGVNVYRGPSLDEEVTKIAITGFKEMIYEIGLDFKIKDGGVFYNPEEVGENNNILLFDKTLPGIVWGNSRFGEMKIPIPHLPDITYLKQTIKHETGHFIGWPKHHDADSNTKLGYKEPSGCVMLYTIPTPNLCDKCKDRLTFLWMFLEKSHDRKYFVKSPPSSYLLH